MDLKKIQKFVWIGILGLVSVCLVLDGIHIYQLRHAWKYVQLLPYQYMELAKGNFLWVYYVFFLLFPDIIAISMYVKTVANIRPCTDQLYHVGIRVFWVLMLCVLGWGYPIREILEIHRHAGQLMDTYGCHENPPTAFSEYFCFAGFPNDYQLVYGTGYSYVESQDVDGRARSYQWVDGFTVSCGIYRTRGFLWLVLIVPLVMADLTFGIINGELALTGESDKIVA